MKAEKRKGSEPIHKVKRDGEHMVPMRDGVHLAADIFRPDAEGKFPALVSLGPWSKELSSDLQWTTPPQPPSTRLWAAPIEAGNSEYLVSRGYVHVIAHIRGLGHSEGAYDISTGWVGKATDTYDLIEWTAQQPWCNGNVGMIGISAYGTIQLCTAIQQPPHLKAIFPYDAPGDLYRDGYYDGGLLSTFILNLGRNWAISGLEQDRVQELKRKAREIRQKVAAQEEDPVGYHIVKDVMMYGEMYNILVHPQVNPWFSELITNPFDGPMYRERSFCEQYDKITIPSYCGAGWYAWTYTHLSGAFRNYAGITRAKAKKLILGPTAHGPGNRWYHLERPFHQYHDEILRWYDYWLKGIDTGIMDEPPIKLFVMGANRWRYEKEWPLARTVWKKLYPRTFGRLLDDPPGTPETTPDVFVQQPLTTTSDLGLVRYQTAPFTRDLEITGPIALNLYASIQVEDKDWVDTNWIVSIRDVDPQGTDRELTRGWLKASHIALDPSKSKPGQPYHLHTKESIEKIEPDRIYEYAIEVRPTSNIFRAGHRIRLEIMSTDVAGPAVFIPPHLCRNDVVVHKIYHTKQYPTNLLLPTIPTTDPTQWLDEERARNLASLQV